MSDDDVIYYGNAFNIARAGDDWAIWRICDDDGNREQIILTSEAMDELCDYFAECYGEDGRASSSHSVTRP